MFAEGRSKLLEEFQFLARACRLSGPDLALYRLRRGGATWFFTTGSLGKSSLGLVSGGEVARCLVLEGVMRHSTRLVQWSRSPGLP